MATDLPPRRQERPFDVLATRYERFAEIQDGIYRPWLTRAIETTAAGITGSTSRDPRHGPEARVQHGRAVDLGCGSGRFTGMLAEHYGDVLAVDIAQREVAIAEAKRGRPNIRYEHRSLLDVTADRDGRFDLVFSVNTIHLLDDHESVLPHLRSLVADGGHAVLVDIVCDPAQWATRRWHYTEGVRNAVRALIRRRSIVDSFSVLRLRLHPVWINKVANGAPLSRGEFHRVYAEVFPGATFTDALQSVSCGLTWQRPTDPAPGEHDPHA
jgi:SAM-dependent methyltransferase